MISIQKLKTYKNQNFRFIHPPIFQVCTSGKSILTSINSLLQAPNLWSLKSKNLALKFHTCKPLIKNFPSNSYSKITSTKPDKLCWLDTIINSTTKSFACFLCMRKKGLNFFQQIQTRLLWWWAIECQAVEV